jgi:hypothetical protein
MTGLAAVGVVKSVAVQHNRGADGGVLRATRTRQGHAEAAHGARDALDIASVGTWTTPRPHPDRNPVTPRSRGRGNAGGPAFAFRPEAAPMP